MFEKLLGECTSYLYCFHSTFGLVRVCGGGGRRVNILTTVSFVFNHFQCVHCFLLSGEELDFLTRTLGKNYE